MVFSVSGFWGRAASDFDERGEPVDEGDEGFVSDVRRNDARPGDEGRGIDGGFVVVSLSERELGSVVAGEEGDDFLA